MRAKHIDVTIVGAGAAGLNAALVLGRARRNVLLCDDGRQRNEVASQMHGFLSRDGFPPQKLLDVGRDELRRYATVDVVSGRVDAIEPSGDAFTIRLDSGEQIRTNRILFATGMRDDLPDVPGMTACWGKSVHVCPYCDGWEVRDRKLAVYGSLRSGVELATELYRWSDDVVVIAPESEALSPDLRRWLENARVTIVESPLRRLIEHGGKLEGLELADGRRVSCDALFLSTALRQHSDLPQRLGCRFEKNGTLEVDATNQTSVRGAYAAGDCVTHRHQVIIAAASGARAAISLNEDLVRRDFAAMIEETDVPLASR